MPDNDLTGKVGLDVTDFKAGVATLNRGIRVIESGFRATAAGLGDWAKSADGLEARMKALTGQIDLQQKKVNSLQAEYKRIAAEKGETSRAAQDLQIKLNKETETLNKMQGELNQTERALSEMEKESKDAAKGAKDLASAEDKAGGATGRLRGALAQLNDRLGKVTGELKNLAGKLLKGLAIGLAAVGAAAIGAAIGVARFVTNAAKAADEIVESAEKIGISTTKYQEFQFIADQIGTDVETVGRAFARTTKALVAADKAGSPMAKTFEELGVSTRDANGNLRDTEAVFGDIIGALGKVENETQREILAQSIFGKSYQELIPLINLGADGLAQMTDEAHKMGAVMDEKTVTALADFNDRLAGMKAGFKGILGQLAAKLLPIVNKVMDAFQAWLASPEVQAGIKNIMEKIGEFADTLGEVIDKLLKGDLKGALKELIPPETVDKIFAVAEAFRSFIQDQLIPFIQKHGPLIKQVLGAIAVGLAAFSIISTVVGWITGLVATIGALSATFTAASGGIAGIVAILGGPLTLVIAGLVALVVGLYLAWKNNWGGIRDTLTAVWENTIKPALQQLWEWLSVAVPDAIEILKFYWDRVLLPALKTFWAWVQANIIPLLQRLWEWLATNVPAAIKTLSAFWNNTLLPALQAVWDFIQTSIVPLFQALWELLSVAGGIAITALQGLWEKVLLPALTKIWAFIQDNVIPILKTLWEWVKDKLGPPLEWLANTILAGLETAFNRVKNAIQWVIDKIHDLIKKLRKLKLPDWLTPGSPTPFELGLRGIADAMDDLARKRLPELQANIGVNKQGQMQQLAPVTVNLYGAVIRDQQDIYLLARKIFEEAERRRR